MDPCGGRELAGRQRTNRMVAELERMARAFDGATVVELVADVVASGGTLTQLARRLSEALGEAEGYISRNMLSKHVNALPGGKEALQGARTEGAHGLAESGIDMVDAAADDGSKEAIAGAKSAADFRLRLAGFWNRAEYAPQQGNQVNVQVTLGEQHLDALRRRRVVHTSVAQVSDGTPDVELVTDGQ